MKSSTLTKIKMQSSKKYKTQIEDKDIPPTKETTPAPCDESDVSHQRAEKSILVLRSKLNDVFLRQEETLVKLKTMCLEIGNSLGGPLRWRQKEYMENVKRYLSNKEGESCIDVAFMSFN
ncbi:uncharacterized protein LOC106150505 [Lingula anatina]|uniref:Uncharacterized protein LOC106150505 n=1 Tax=Lingula anatina TaxID=7574 RepID=A0A1S3GYI3_LINAN|nr:uncharacterized protein LOC106150505 [Lingula anatina]|eukprot:XP_013378818.1 uncharacterized protein LOC106150505 [Lingula anatina]